MANPKGRPKTFSGSAVEMRLPALMSIRIKAAAQEKGKSISDVIRETLAPVFGAGEAERHSE